MNSLPEAKVKDAIDRGFILPRMKEWAVALCSQDADSFDSFIAQTVPPYAHLRGRQTPPAFPTNFNSIVQSDLAGSICSQLGLPAGTLKS